MVRFLADTCLMSDAKRGRAAPLAWVRATPPTAVFVSVVSLGEFRRGVVKLMRSDIATAQRLAAWLETIRAEFATRILPISDEVALRWGELTAQRPRPLADALIAATALVHGLTVVTRNVADFADTGVSIVDPWRDA